MADENPAAAAPNPAPAAAAAPGGAPAAAAAPAASAPAPTDAQPKPGETNATGEGDNKGAPESYTDFTAPEDVVLDPTVLSEFKGIAKELNLSQTDAQKVIDRLGPTVAKQQQAQIKETVENAHKEWTAASKADTEFGGDKLDANLAVAKTALDTYGTPELKKLLVDSGLGNHPEVIRFCYRAGKAAKEDGHVAGSPPPSEKTPAQILYG